MSTLSFKRINKVYDNSVQAVFDFNLEVKDKEFIVFVGPSGCGKSTTLRMIAGLEDITSGELFIDNVLVNNIEPKDRNIAMVFQNYALYPHMTVYGNMAFALKLRKVSKPLYDACPEADFYRALNNRILAMARHLRKKSKKVKTSNKKDPFLEEIYNLNLKYEVLRFYINKKHLEVIDKAAFDFYNGENVDVEASRKKEMAEINAELEELKHKYDNTLANIKFARLVRKGKLNASEYVPAPKADCIDYACVNIFEEIKKLYELAFKNEDKAVELLEKGHQIGIYEEKIKEIESQIKGTRKELVYFKRAQARGGYNEVSTMIIEEGIVQRESQLANFEKQLEYYSNTEVPLFKARKLSKYEMDLEINKAAKILDLTQYLLRKPAALSGGQRQRVALGRCIVRNPKVFLMDEPLSNLDAKLRVQTRTEIINIHQKVGATTIYVTHDQTEAMTMADRIVVMKDGYIQQIGTPEEIYSNPANIFVAGFIGNPPMNFFNAKFNGEKVVVKDKERTLEISVSKDQIESLKAFDGKDIVVGVRPEVLYAKDDVKLEKENNLFKLKIEFVELLGYEDVLYSNICGQKFLAKISHEYKAKVGDEIDLFVNTKDMYFFDGETTKIIDK